MPDNGLLLGLVLFVAVLIWELVAARRASSARDDSRSVVVHGTYIAGPVTYLTEAQAAKAPSAERVVEGTPQHYQEVRVQDLVGLCRVLSGRP